MGNNSKSGGITNLITANSKIVDYERYSYKR